MSNLRNNFCPLKTKTQSRIKGAPVRVSSKSAMMSVIPLKMSDPRYWGSQKTLISFMRSDLLSLTLGRSSLNLTRVQELELSLMSRYVSLLAFSQVIMEVSDEQNDHNKMLLQN